ncbi:fumarylacetoacetate hydrolase family protein [Sporomusa aerivorans]|uniref:fumarylacetoacetate hydrolase family protein n=1 Tax=Sporomusa aerivorans TaxID=204936 RepID=UPI00352A047F
MRLATIKHNGAEIAAVVTPAGLLPVETINEKLNKAWATELQAIIQSGHLEEMNNWYRAEGKEELNTLAQFAVSKEKVQYGPLFRNPAKIWGIGLNYVDHAGDLAEKTPTVAPASFAKFATTIIGPGDPIKVPVQSEKTTAEAELAIIFGKKCKDVEEADWLSAVAGFTTIIDMTAEDILRINPRYLTRSKNFDTFLSLGPVLVTPDEIDHVTKLKVATVSNGEVYAQNIVSNMTFPPAYLVSFHSKVATMLPGDILLTGTPRAVHIQDGDIVECRIDGFETLVNPVIDLKVKK